LASKFHETSHCQLTVSIFWCELVRQVNLQDLSQQLDEDNIKVTMSDFIRALDEVKPAFGAAINTLEMCRY
jgi:SpoVK/Ycf46/Vps4 family AAA+-type ATPase